MKLYLFEKYSKIMLKTIILYFDTAVKKIIYGTGGCDVFNY